MPLLKYVSLKQILQRDGDAPIIFRDGVEEIMRNAS